MKIYLAARAKTRANEVIEIRKKLSSLGHKIEYEWDPSKVKLPYRKNRSHNLPTYSKMLESAASSDVFILLDEPGLRGAYVELGVFLYEALKDSKNKQVFIVGKDSVEREHIFESPNFVHFVDNIEHVYRALI